MPLTRLRRRLQYAVAILVIVGLVTNGAVLVLFSRSLAGIRGDFCAWTRVHYRATLELPQVPARVEAERSDVALLAQLGCRAQSPTEGKP